MQSIYAPEHPCWCPTLMLRCAPRESAHIDVCCTHRSSNIARLGITPESMEANTASTPRRRLGICETVASRNLPTVISMRSPGDVCWYNAGRQTLAPALLASSSARSTCRCSEARRHVSSSRGRWSRRHGTMHLEGSAITHSWQCRMSQCPHVLRNIITLT